MKMKTTRNPNNRNTKRAGYATMAGLLAATVGVVGYAVGQENGLADRVAAREPKPGEVCDVFPFASEHDVDLTRFARDYSNDSSEIVKIRQEAAALFRQEHPLALCRETGSEAVRVVNADNVPSQQIVDDVTFDEAALSK